MSNQLRECPFCGGEAESQEMFIPEDRALVRCVKCGAQVVKGYLSEAIATWNRRREPDGWISVADRLPAAEKQVLAHYKSKVMGYSRIVSACYIPPKTMLSEDLFSGNCDDIDHLEEYDEENDCYWALESWYEIMWEEGVYWKIEQNITHWRPLPEPPGKE